MTPTLPGSLFSGKQRVGVSRLSASNRRAGSADLRLLICEIAGVRAGGSDSVARLRREYCAASSRRCARGSDAAGRQADVRRGRRRSTRRRAASSGLVSSRRSSRRSIARCRAPAGSDRYDAFRRQFMVPPDRLARVFDRAIAECRSHTGARHAAGRRALHRQCVTNKPWAATALEGDVSQPDPGEHRSADLHRSRDRSRVPRRLQAPRLQRAARAAPGARSRWTGFTIYPLFAAVADCGRGANYGIEFAFPGDRQLAFERDVLFQSPARSRRPPPTPRPHARH